METSVAVVVFSVVIAILLVEEDSAHRVRLLGMIDTAGSPIAGARRHWRLMLAPVYRLLDGTSGAVSRLSVAPLPGDSCDGLSWANRPASIFLVLEHWMGAIG